MSASNAAVGTATKKKATGKTKAAETIGGVKLSRVDKDRLAAVAATMGIVPSGMIPTLQAMQAKFAELPDDELAVCDACGGDSPLTLEACPFCGLTNEESAQSDAVSSSGPADSAAMVPSRRAPNLMAGGAVADGVVVSAGEAQLNDSVTQINTAKRDTAAAYFQLGMTILHVFKTKIWQQRQRNGKPAYKSFEDFRRVELRLAKSTVYGMMKLVERFSIGEIEKYGPDRLSHILMAPAAKQDEFASFVKHGGEGGGPVPTRKARQKLREINKGENKGKGSKGGRPPVQARPGELTIATVLNKKQIVPLWQPKKDSKGNPVAAKLEDNAYGFIDLKNGARIVIKLGHFPTRQGKLIVEFRGAE